MITLQKERDFGDKINASFSFISQNFKTLFLSLLYFAGPLSLIGGIANGIVQINNLGFASFGKTKPLLRNFGDIFADYFGESFANLFTINYIIATIFLILASVTVAITVYAFISEYNKTEKSESINIESIRTRIQAIFLPVLGSYGIIFLIIILILLAFGGIIGALISAGGGFLASLIAVMFGLLAFLTLLYFGVIFSLSPAIVAYEGMNSLEALGRARFLIKGKWWATFGLLMIITIINSFISMIFGVPAMIFTFMKVLKVDGVISGNTPLIISTVISTIGQLVVSSLTYVAISFQYFNLVEKREANGLKRLIDGIGKKKLDLNGDGEF